MREVKQNQGEESDWPDEEYVKKNVDWIVVVSTIESEMLLQINQSHFGHELSGKFFNHW